MPFPVHISVMIQKCHIAETPMQTNPLLSAIFEIAEIVNSK